jgi:hypothetical protein
LIVCRAVILPARRPESHEPLIRPHRRAEQPEEAGFRHAEVAHQEDRRRQHVDEEAAEVEGEPAQASRKGGEVSTFQ